MQAWISNGARVLNRLCYRFILPWVDNADARLLRQHRRDTVDEFAELDLICIFLAVTFWSGL